MEKIKYVQLFDTLPINKQDWCEKSLRKSKIRKRFQFLKRYRLFHLEVNLYTLILEKCVKSIQVKRRVITATTECPTLAPTLLHCQPITTFLSYSFSFLFFSFL